MDIKNCTAWLGRSLALIAIGGAALLGHATADGTTLFYSDAGFIWSIPVTGDSARKIGRGDAVAFDPKHKDLVVQLNEKDGVQLVRMPITGGSAEPISKQVKLEIAPDTLLGSGAVRGDGRIAFSTISPSNPWFVTGGTFDPDTGDLRRLPLRYDGDVVSVNWSKNNEIVTAGLLLRSSDWRFRRDTGSQ